jgi:carotenoid 1,2-hydratase
LVVIAFVGSVFSPYYAAARRRGTSNPLDHCAINVALYGRGANYWAMTERRRTAVWRSANTLQVGPSTLLWNDHQLSLAISETTVPLPRGLRGRIRVLPHALADRSFALDPAGRHVWQPVAPSARIEAVFDRPAFRWSGTGYVDSNYGDRPLERDFASWTWARARTGDDHIVLYDVLRRDAGPAALALQFDRHAEIEEFAPPPESRLPTTPWRLERTIRSDEGSVPRVIRTLEDSPFYARSTVAARWRGAPAVAMHESLSLDRFERRWMQLMLPFRMPRAWR